MNNKIVLKRIYLSGPMTNIPDPATCPDSPRYKGCGNGWATNQPRWILTRLLAICENIDCY